MRGASTDRAARCATACAALAAGVLLGIATAASAQVRNPGQETISEHVGPLGPVSVPVSAGSRPVRDGLGTIGETSRPMHGGGPVRDRWTRSMRSGPVSSLSRGPMTQPRTAPHGGSVTAASAGAVKHDIDRPLGSRISQPLRELAPLQQHLRALREHGDASAITAAAAPLAGPLPDVPDTAHEPGAHDPTADLHADALQADVPHGDDADVPHAGEPLADLPQADTPHEPAAPQ